jgi:3-phenylpropionate/trans-cinnamate dioxygenase ferredoxin reductase component
LRVEHEDNANAMGEAAGRLMAGDETPYHYLPYFYSDLFDLGYEAIGDTSPSHATVTHWREPYRKGAIFYLNGGGVCGIVFWNMWNGIAAGRALLGEPGPFSKVRLKEWLEATFRD